MKRRQAVKNEGSIPEDCLSAQYGQTASEIYKLFTLAWRTALQSFRYTDGVLKRQQIKRK